MRILPLLNSLGLLIALLLHDHCIYHCWVTSDSTTNDASIALTFTSSEATTTFAVGDISVSGGELSAFAATSDTGDTEYTAILYR